MSSIDYRATGIIPINRQHASLTAGGIGLLIKKLRGAAQLYYDIAVDASTGDITIRSGASSGAAAADTNFGLPTKNGVYDVSDSTANTFAKIIADINASTSLRAIPGDAAVGWISNNTLFTRSATEITGAGLPLYLDVAVALITSTFITPIRLSPLADYANYKNFLSLLHNPNLNPAFPKRFSKLSKVLFNTTGSSAVARVEVWREALDGTLTKIWSEAGAATTVDKTVTFSPELECPPGESIIAAYTSDVLPTACVVNVIGSSIADGLVSTPMDRLGTESIGIY